MDLQNIISIVITAGVILLLCKLIFGKKKNDISIEINHCLECPFNYKKEGMLHHRCKLQKIIEHDVNEELSHATLNDMKRDACPFDKLEIIVKERK